MTRFFIVLAMAGTAFAGSALASELMPGNGYSLHLAGHDGALSQQRQAQSAGCAADHICIADQAEAAVARPDQTFMVAEAGDPPSSERCPGISVDVTAASSDERRLACLAAGDAIQLLARCGIKPRQAVHVQILSEVRHPFGGVILGFFDPKRDKVFVSQEANIPSLVKDTPYASLPQRDFYKSLIVHEVVHGIMHQNLKRPASTHAAYEYPAYALQIESLTPQFRNMFLQSFDKRTVETVRLFSDPIFSSTRTTLRRAPTTISRLQRMAALISPLCWKAKSPSSPHLASSAVEPI